MRSRRSPHAPVALAALLVAIAVAPVSGQAPAQPGGQPTAADMEPLPAPAPKGPVTPAGSASSSSDIPDYTPGPAKFAVTPFENHVVRGTSFEWIVAEAPFEIAEKTESVLGLDPALSPIYVPGERVPAEPDTVGEFGARMGVTYVVTGWFDRPGQDFRIAVLVWKVAGKTASVAGESQKLGALTDYHKLLGQAIAEAWTKANVASVDLTRAEKLEMKLGTTDLYPVTLMGRGLGYYTGALAAMAAADMAGSGSGSAAKLGPDYKNAEHDLERAVFVDPKLYQAQRLVGDLYMAEAALPAPAGVNDGKLMARAAGKFNYAADLAPDDLASLRAAAFSMAAAQKWDVALGMFRRLVTRKPWDLELRYQLGQAMWQTGDAQAAQRQLEQVTQRAPDHLPARRVLVLIHASRSDTPKLISELEAIAVRAPNDLDIKADLATAYGAVNQWSKAVGKLEEIAAMRPNDMPLHVRIGDGHRKAGELDRALEWYGKAQKLAPESSLPGFALAQSLYDANRLGEANKAYVSLQKYWADLPAAEQALGSIAILQNKPNEAAWYLRRAVREQPRSLPTRQGVIAAELMRRDAIAALQQLEPALANWPEDGMLHYLAGIAYHLNGDAGQARAHLAKALQFSPGLGPARSAIGVLDAGGSVALEFKPELQRPWGDGDALQEMIDRYSLLAATMATVRVEYQGHMLSMLGWLGAGPEAKLKPDAKGIAVATRPKPCPVGRLAKSWAAAQDALVRYERLGVELEAAYRFIARHDDAGMSASLLPNTRTQLAGVKKGFKTILNDVSELRSEWTRGLGMELRATGCTDKLLAAAVADPQRYKVIEEDAPDPIPQTAALRPKPRTTFFVDNSRCPDPIDVFIDGSPIGQVAPGRRSALVADGGERALCLLGPGSAQCGDRGTVRQVYLHDGWSVTIHCPK